MSYSWKNVAFHSSKISKSSLDLHADWSKLNTYSTQAEFIGAKVSMSENSMKFELIIVYYETHATKHRIIRAVADITDPKMYFGNLVSQHNYIAQC